MEALVKTLTVPGKTHTVGDSALGRLDDQAQMGLLDLMMDVFAESLRADRISILLLDSVSGCLTIEASRGLPRQVVHSTRIPSGEGIAGLALEERIPLLIRGNHKPAYLKVPLTHPELAASLVIPIYHDLKALGVICAGTQSHPESFTPRNLDWMVEVANRIGPVLMALQGQKRRNRTIGGLMRLMEILERLGHLQDETEAIDLALKSSGRICQCRHGLFMPVSDEAPLWDSRGAHSLNRTAWSEEETHWLSALGREALQGRKLTDRVVALHAPQEARQPLLDKGIERVVAMPVAHGNSPYGLLFSFPHRGAREPVRMLRSLAAHLGTALSRARHLRQLEKLAFMDELTGIYSRSYWMERFREEFIRGEREGRPLSILLFDIDDFKACNDTYGHAVGDAVLARVAQAIGNSARNFDNVCRFGEKSSRSCFPVWTGDWPVRLPSGFGLTSRPRNNPDPLQGPSG
jgi:GAF domain-containing protein